LKTHVEAKGEIRMASHNQSANKLQFLLFIAFIAAGIIFLGAAMSQQKAAEPPGWTAINEQVGTALEQLAQNDGGDASNPGTAAETAGPDVVQKPGTVAKTSGSDGAQSTGTKSAEADQSGAGTAGGSPKAAGEAVREGASDGRIDINRASAEELETLPGIGMAKAKLIVDDREKNGPFHSADDLLRVKGIGPKLLEKMKPSIVAGS
jgi:competence protein ComEA